MKSARYVRLVREGETILLKIGPGDHTEQPWIISKDQLRSLVLDAMPIVLASDDF
jgi:hypothetical protein